jgi:hypothetical protein
MHNLPNVLTILRLALVPAMAYCLALDMHAVALALFLAAALSDLADGYIARWFDVTSLRGSVRDRGRGRTPRVGVGREGVGRAKGCEVTRPRKVALDQPPEAGMTNM